MERETQEELDILRGRVIALEELMVGYLAMMASQYSIPKDEILANWLKAIKQSAQNAQRAIGPRPDAAWEAAVQSLEHLFDRAAQRKA